MERDPDSVHGTATLTPKNQIELATVQETVSNTVIGKMRMQFWRDAVKGISDVRRRVLLGLCRVERDALMCSCVGQTPQTPHRARVV